VVSEETGKISIATHGQLLFDLTDEELNQLLVKSYQVTPAAP